MQPSRTRTAAEAKLPYVYFVQYLLVVIVDAPRPQAPSPHQERVVPAPPHRLPTVPRNRIAYAGDRTPTRSSGPGLYGVLYPGADTDESQDQLVRPLAQKPAWLAWLGPYYRSSTQTATRAAYGVLSIGRFYIERATSCSTCLDLHQDLSCLAA